MKKFIDKLKFIGLWLVKTNLGRIALSFIWLLIWLGIDRALYNNNWDYSGWAFWVAVPAIVYLVGFTLVAIVYGWIINPIRDAKRRKK